MIYAQGDIILEKIDKLPVKGLMKKDKILAYGEVTGHKHQFQPELKTVQVFKDTTQETQFVDVQSDQAELCHEDHANIMIPKGVYEVRVQREVDMVEGVRQVMD